MMKLIEDGI